MNALHVKAILVQDFHIIRRDLLARSDIFFFAFLNVFVLGGISLYLSGGAGSAKGELLLVGMVLWEVVRVAQYFMASWTLWNLYTSNLSNLFIAPLTSAEFVVGNIIAAVYKTVILLIPLVIVTRLVFDFNLASVGILVLIISVVDLLLFACAFALTVIGIIFRFGVRVQALSWAGVFVFQPLMGVYFPIELLPAPLELIARAIPATYVFEGIHASLDGSGHALRSVLIGFGLNLVALGISIKIFVTLFHKARVSGQFARNES